MIFGLLICWEYRSTVRVKVNTKHEIDWLSHYFWTGCRIDFWLVVCCSLLQAAFVMQWQHIKYSILSLVVINDVFCKMVNFGPINTKFNTVVYWVPQRSQNMLHNILQRKSNTINDEDFARLCIHISNSGNLIWIPFKIICSIICYTTSSVCFAWNFNDINKIGYIHYCAVIGSTFMYSSF